MTDHPTLTDPERTPPESPILLWIVLALLIIFVLAPAVAGNFLLFFVTLGGIL